MCTEWQDCQNESPNWDAGPNEAEPHALQFEALYRLMLSAGFISSSVTLADI